MMKAGFSKVCINPPLGMAMEGLARSRGCESIHDDLLVRALFLTHQENKVLILSFDLLFFERAVIDRFKGAIGRCLDLRPSQIFLNTTHTHCGPQVSRWKYSVGPEVLYLDQVEEAMLAAAGEAGKNQREVTVWAGSTETDMPVSRRKVDQQGKAHWMPSLKAIVCNALPFCLFKDAHDQVVSILFSISCHPSMIYECAISAEFPGAAVRKLNGHFKTDGSIFLQGAAGDTKPRPIAIGEEKWGRATWDQMEAAGGAIADAVISKAKNVKEVMPDLRVELTDISWPLEPAPKREHFEAALGKGANPPVAEWSPHQLWAQDMLRRLERRQRLPETVPVALHMLQIARGLRLVGVEGEIVGELGLLILHCYDQGVTFPLGYSNGCAIYLPTTRMLPQGGYEVDSYWEYHHPSPLAPHGEKALEKVLIQFRDTGRIPNG